MLILNFFSFFYHDSTERKLHDAVRKLHDAERKLRDAELTQLTAPLQDKLENIKLCFCMAQNHKKLKNGMI